jgi:hypothetical protein
LTDRQRIKVLRAGTEKNIAQASNLGAPIAMQRENLLTAIGKQVSLSKQQSRAYYQLGGPSDESDATAKRISAMKGSSLIFRVAACARGGALQTRRRYGRWICRAFALMTLSSAGMAATLAPAGCPTFHCTVEATGVVYQPFIQTPLIENSNDSLGSLLAQGCSGNGTTLTCLYSDDEATGIARGTLKLLDATTLQPIWGSAGAANSYDLASTATYGQVPVNFSDGSIAAGDATFHVLYNASGAVIGKLAVSGRQKNLGLTLLSATYGVVSQEDGILTLVNVATWQNVGSLTLRDPQTKEPVRLVSPSSGTANTLYAVARNPKNNNGFLYSVALKAVSHHLVVSSVFTFIGVSGASPVVATPAASGLPDNLVLLHVPGLPGDPQPQNRLLGLDDSPATGLAPIWGIPLTAALIVGPTVDQASGSLFYQDTNRPNINQISLMTGDPLNVFDLQAIGKYTHTFVLNGHLAASQVGGLFTLLLAGKNTSSLKHSAQYIMAFQPIVSPTALLWSYEIANVSGTNSAAWNFAPSSQPGVVCPIVVANTGATSTITRVCDF